MSAQNHTPQWLPLDGAVNARAVVPGVLLRADNLQSLTPRDVRRLVEEEALEVVLDLRTDSEVTLEGPGPLTAEPVVRIEADTPTSTPRSSPGARRTGTRGRRSRRWSAPT